MIRLLALLAALTIPWTAAAQPSSWDIGYGTPKRSLERQLSTDSRLRGFQYSVGAGLGMLALGSASGDSSNHQRFGFTIDGKVGYRFNRWLGANLLLLSGFTAFDRTESVAQAAIDAGSWTSQAIVDLGKWSYEDVWRALLMSSVGSAAYTVLLMTYVAVPVLLAASPFAALSHMAAGPTLSGHFGDELWEGFIEAGAGGLFYFHPLDKGIRPGVGPVFGLGLRYRWFGFGTRLLWSPPGAHGEAHDARTQLFTFSTTARVNW